MFSLITGADGFIGSNLAEKCGKKILCDISDNCILPHEAISRLRTKDDVECVYHLGAISSTTETNISAITESNVKFSSDLLEICIEKSIPFVYASSASVYGLGEFGFSEEARGNPLNYYAISKTAFDMFACQKIKDNPHSKIVGLRYFNVYGHNEDHKKGMASPVHKFLEQSKSGRIKVFEGSEGFLRDFIHVSDVVSITKNAKGFPSGIYNVGTGVARSFLDVAEIISSITGADIEEIPFPDHLVGKYQDFTCSDNKKISMYYEDDRVTLDEGIRRVYDRRLR